MGRVEHYPALAFPANLVAHKAINSTMAIFLFVFQTLPEPKAFPGTVDDICFMSQAIQQGGSQGWFSEDLRPVSKTQIAGDDD